MDKRLIISIACVVLLSLLIGGTILLSKPADKSKENKNTMNINKNNTSVKNKSNQSIESTNNSNTESTNIVKKETINVFNNEAKLDLHANLVENINGQVLLNLAYKKDGKLVTKNIDASKVTEIRNIFRFREKYGNGYKLKNMLLNRKKQKLYFSVEGKQKDKYTQTTIYSYNFNNSKIDKIFYDLGVFSDFHVSPNGDYSAFSYLSCPQNLARNEKNIVIIVNSDNNKLELNSCQDFVDQTAKSNDLFIYSYDFVKWQDRNICQLRQKIKAKDGSREVKEQLIYYNTILNKLSEIV